MTPIEKAQAKSDALKALGLYGQARPGEIRAAWKRLAFETHPDRNGGALDAFAEARAAYDLLASQLPARQETGAAQPRGPSGSGADRVAMGRRPSVAGKVTEFPEATLERCRALLEDGASADAPARTSQAGRRTTDHVARSVHCRGRCLTYAVATPLRGGINRVALPTNILEDPRKAKPEIISFRANDSGAGDVEIPEVLRARLFPGARSVCIRFAKA